RCLPGIADAAHAPTSAEQATTAVGVRGDKLHCTCRLREPPGCNAAAVSALRRSRGHHVTSSYEYSCTVLEPRNRLREGTGGLRSVQGGITGSIESAVRPHRSLDG